MNQPKVLFVSNGAGEDSIALQIISKIKHCQVEAMPLVGSGTAYYGTCPVVGPQKNMPSGGLLPGNTGNLIKDVSGGLLSLIFNQILWLRQNKGNYSQVIPVGDTWAAALAALSGIRPITFIGTAKSSYHHPYSSLECFIFRWFGIRCIVRDEITANAMRAKGVRAIYVGNAMMDGLEPKNLDLGKGKDEQGLALFPGSRKETYSSLPKMLEIYRLLVAALKEKNIKAPCPIVAIAPSIHIAKLALSCPNYDFTQTGLNQGKAGELIWRGREKMPNVSLVKDDLADVLDQSIVAFGKAGTAHEQAAGWGLPVVSYEKGGETALDWYRGRQKGLLGDALIVAEDNPEQIIKELVKLFEDPMERTRRGAIGKQRLGKAGGAEKMAEIIQQLSYRHRRVTL